MRGERFIIPFLLGNIANLLTDNIIPIPTLPLLATSAILILLYIKFPQYTTIAYVTMFIIGFTNCQRPQYSIEIRSKSFTILKEFRAAARESFSDKLAHIITDKEDRAVAIAFTIGDKSLIPNSTKQAYRDSGAMHILAQSGLHIGIIYGIISTLLYLMDMSYRTRTLKLILCGLFIMAYALISGFDASVLRAAIMILIYRSTGLAHRESGKWSALLTTALVIVAANPKQLENIGFQLSFAAVAGIIAIHPTITGNICQILPHPKNFWNKFFITICKRTTEAMSLSISCQIATLPFIMYHFNTFPTYFLITNIVAIPLVTISLYAIAGAFLLSPIPLLGEVAAGAARISLSMLNYIIHYIGD